MDAERAARIAKKLLARAKSANPHEAASARQMADDIVLRYGLDEEDLKEDEIEVVADETYDVDHLALAEVIAHGRSCRTTGVRWIGFRGKARNVEVAVATYRALAQHAFESEVAAMRGAPEEAVVVWRTCYFMGLVPEIARRLKKTAPVETTPDKPWNGAVEVTTPDDLQRARIDAAARGAIHAVENLAEILENQDVENIWDRIDRLRKRAHRAGAQAGQTVEIPQPIAVAQKKKKAPEPPAIVGLLPPKASRWKPWRARTLKIPKPVRKPLLPTREV